MIQRNPENVGPALQTFHNNLFEYKEESKLHFPMVVGVQLRELRKELNKLDISRFKDDPAGEELFKFFEDLGVTRPNLSAKSADDIIRRAYIGELNLGDGA